MRGKKHLAGWGRTTFWLMTTVCGLLLITGGVLFVWPSSAVMDLSPAQADLRHSAGVVHGVCTWFFCLMCGRGVWPHVRVMWHKSCAASQWGLGLTTLCLLGAIALTGLFLLYGGPDLQASAAALHFWMGTVCSMIFLAHTWRRFIPSKSDLH